MNTFLCLFRIKINYSNISTAKCKKYNQKLLPFKKTSIFLLLFIAKKRLVIAIFNIKKNKYV